MKYLLMMLMLLVMSCETITEVTVEPAEVVQEEWIKCNWVIAESLPAIYYTSLIPETYNWDLYQSNSIELMFDGDVALIKYWNEDRYEIDEATSYSVSYLEE